MDYALGCLLGVAVGDAAGATLERDAAAAPVKEAEAREAMAMPGSVWPRLGQGQTTDDTELTICLARGLLGHLPSSGFPAESVARQYSYWHEAGAFGGGMTCQTAFSAPLEPDRFKWPKAGQEGEQREAPPLWLRMQMRAARYSSESQANGALMRVAPLAVWGHRLPPAELAEHAAADARLSHPNQACCDASAAYCIAVAHLIASPGDAAGALQAACAWAEEQACEEVQQWVLRDSAQPLDTIACHGPTAGWARWSLTLAFHHLRRAIPFEDSIRLTLCRGGDTDTNAAIVGGMTGALHGAAAIPGYMLSPVLEYAGREEQGGGVPRPPDLRAAVLPDLAEQLYQLATAEGG
ncbi:hypothetical protein ABPG75_011173 [Micractinium tetrahymenae]